MAILGRDTKKCPRCEAKCLQSQLRCPECGLIFSRMENATNAAAVQRFKERDKEAVLYVKQVPKDKKKWKLILYTVLLGLFGGGYFYVRRWQRGLFYLLGFALLVVCVVFNAQLISVWDGVLIEFLGIFVGVYGVAWIFDIVYVCTGKFKIPVSLPKEESK